MCVCVWLIFQPAAGCRNKCHFFMALLRGPVTPIIHKPPLSSSRFLLERTLMNKERVKRSVEKGCDHWYQMAPFATCMGRKGETKRGREGHAYRIWFLLGVTLSFKHRLKGKSRTYILGGFFAHFLFTSSSPSSLFQPPSLYLIHQGLYLTLQYHTPWCPPMPLCGPPR